MKLIQELDLENFQAWAGAVRTLDKIKQENKTQNLECLLEDLYPDGIDRTMLNDILWFESDWLFENLGITEDEDEE